MPRSAARRRTDDIHAIGAGDQLPREPSVEASVLLYFGAALLVAMRSMGEKGVGRERHPRAIGRLPISIFSGRGVYPVQRLRDQSDDGVLIDAVMRPSLRDQRKRKRLGAGGIFPQPRVAVGNEGEPVCLSAAAPPGGSVPAQLPSRSTPWDSRPASLRPRRRGYISRREEARPPAAPAAIQWATPQFPA
jgi:hypothetical protein